MAGKILKVATNDLSGKVDERKAAVFACFKHIKYMNDYVVFSFDGEYSKKKLCYGSIHLKDKSLVIFSVKDNIKKYIDEFLSEYISDKIENFKILDIDKLEKVEIISYNEMDYKDLQLLDDKSIIRIVSNESNASIKKPIFLYFMIFVLILLSIGLTLLYLYPDMFTVKYKELVCSNNLYDEKMMLNYDIESDIKFDGNDKVIKNNVVKTYTFLDSNSYYNFKNNSNYEEYFSSGETYKFIDGELKLKLFYSENYVIDDYDEMLTYLKREGFSCIETEYEK